MRRLARLNLAQRIVAVIALAGLLRTIGNLLTSPEAGWFSYAPLTAAVPDDFPRGGWRAVAMTLVWLALITLWGAISIWLLRLPSTRDAQAGAD